MEEKIYMRQVSKTQLAQRVVDEHQLDRHFTYQELKELYSFDPNVYDENVEPSYAMPKDDILKSLLHKHKSLIVKYHEHDSLLENKIDEGLTEEERQLAWQQYEQENKRKEMEEANMNAIMEQVKAAQAAQAALATQTALAAQMAAGIAQNVLPPISFQGGMPMQLNTAQFPIQMPISNESFNQIQQNQLNQ